MTKHESLDHWAFYTKFGRRMKMHAKATFRIVSWDEKPFDEPEVGPKLTQAHVKKSFEGDLLGTGNLMYVMVHLDDAKSLVHQVSRWLWAACAGEPEASFYGMWGLPDGEKANAEWEVVPGSGIQPNPDGAFGYGSGTLREHARSSPTK